MLQVRVRVKQHDFGRTLPVACICHYLPRPPPLKMYVWGGGYPLFLHTFLPCPQNGPGENVAYIYTRISRVAPPLSYIFESD